MTTVQTQKLTFDNFLEKCPEKGIYELVNGEIVEVRATRNHDDVANFLLFSFNDEIRRLNLNLIVTNTAVIKTLRKDGVEQGINPDVSVIDRTIWRSNHSDYNALQMPIQLAVEVTSTNWEDDYVDKLDEYQRLGITEYWIVDYLAIASRAYLGNPKVPTVFVFYLDKNAEYQRTQFRGAEQITSPTFPELSLTAEQVLTA
ncbi:MAG: Uma2 family endonuclease [Okeania sp. SIO3C4]|nr:Uma2 family endonuclease [Okeania sp. SIO3B3]NER03437.1 Uma2 family endonuclease [Okeania sp. SIO3C4]